MIEKLRIDGFKSLKDFEIKFQKGLNVLIGPNGVGKTNICQGLTILNALSNNSLYESFTQFGGVGSTFNSVDCKPDQKKITIEAEGNTDGRYQNQSYDLKFKYSITLTIIEELLITNETLDISRKTIKNVYKKILSITQDSKQTSVKILDNELIGDTDIIKKGEKQFKMQSSESKNNTESFLPLMSRIFFVCHLVVIEFRRIKSLNIDPNVARLSYDITEPHEMLGNGRYLANTLHFLNKKDSDLNEVNLILEQLIPNYKEITPDISDTGKRFFLIKDKYKNKFSSNSLSDGTIKIIALLVGIVRQRGRTTIIEEPENYLHPYANTLLINYLRETFEEGTCILTSHSETVLNLLRPEELIICELEGCFTKCNRLQNISKIKEVIQESGFGCGYHYLAGNIGGVPNFQY